MNLKWAARRDGTDMDSGHSGVTAKGMAPNRSIRRLV